MSVHILHHGRCFDGASSAAIFAAFYRARINAAADIRYIPKNHCRGDPFVESDFDCETAACVDFRYSQHPGLDWYFDHHHSAFQLPGDLEHFRADRSGKKFHDPTPPSCAGYLARVAAENFGFDPTPLEELIRWADIIDSAAFPSAEVAVMMSAPALQLAAFIQSTNDPQLIDRFIEDLQTESCTKLTNASYVRKVVDERMELHREDMSQIAASTYVENDVLEYNLLGNGPKTLSHFIPYHQHPGITYVVGVYQHSDGDLRLTVGYNPWLPPERRQHNLAALCERHGGGGHAFVAGCSFPRGKESHLLATKRAMVQVLRGEISPDELVGSRGSADV